jgi:hypothetical protein
VMTDARSRSLLIHLLLAVLLAALQGLAVMPSIGRAYGRLVGLAMVGFVCPVVAGSSSAATTTPLAGALYSYDWAAPNTQRAVRSTPRVTQLMDALAARDAERRPTRPPLADFMCRRGRNRRHLRHQGGLKTPTSASRATLRSGSIST